MLTFIMYSKILINYYLTGNKYPKDISEGNNKSLNNNKLFIQY